MTIEEANANAADHIKAQSRLMYFTAAFMVFGVVFSGGMFAKGNADLETNFDKLQTSVDGKFAQIAGYLAPFQRVQDLEAADAENIKALNERMANMFGAVSAMQQQINDELKHGR